MGSNATDTDPSRAPHLIQTLGFGRAVCADLGQAERREWWLSNGRGAYAAGTIAGTLTRRYHGLLIANAHPPLGRTLMFTKAEATLIDGDREWPLFTNRWASGAVEPAGHVLTESFRLNGRMPVWVFAIGAMRIEQRIWLEQGCDRVYCAWRRLPGSPERALQLRVALLVNARDHHQVSAAGGLDPEIVVDGAAMTVAFGPGPVGPLSLGVRAIGGQLAAAPAWIEGFDLPRERERGLEDCDNHLRVGFAHLDLTPGRWVGIAAATNEPPEGEPSGLDLDAAIRRHLDRDRHLLETACGDEAEAANPFAGAPDWIRRLLLAADSFVFARPLHEDPAGESIIAGYPWFGDWGRDTMIALPGLCLATGRFGTARRILETFACFIDGGMLPNLFPGSGEQAEYNSVDAALWYIEAWRAYLEATGDTAALQRAWPALQSIVDGYRGGTRYGIGMDPADGLVRAGEPGVQLTWMDAKVHDWVVTPRIGKPVEVNALWYNALVVMGELAGRIGADAAPFAELASRVSDGFQRFIRADGEGLFDVLDGPEGNDAAIRPNQILAVSLPSSALSAQVQAAIVSCCAEHLLTSYGLRTLAPSDPAYRGTYLGDVLARDGAYHQGTVWAWLLGHYVIAEYRVQADRALALSRLAPLASHIRDAGLGSISEIFDGDPPHAPRGTPAQAWSVGCTLEAYWRVCAAG